MATRERQRMNAAAHLLNKAFQKWNEVDAKIKDDCYVWMITDGGLDADCWTSVCRLVDALRQYPLEQEAPHADDEG